MSAGLPPSKASLQQDLKAIHHAHHRGNGVHVKVASERLGHSTTGITMDLYQHVMPGMQEDAAAQIDAAYVKAIAGPKQD